MKKPINKRLDRVEKAIKPKCDVAQVVIYNAETGEYLTRYTPGIFTIFIPDNKRGDGPHNVSTESRKT